MSMLAPQDPFGLNQTAQPSAENLAAYLSDAEYKALSDAYTPDTSLYKNMSSLYGNQPSMTTQVNAQSVPEGIMKGISAGIGNVQSQRNYGNQVKAYRDMAAVQQQAQQRQLDLANLRAKAQYTNMQTVNQGLGTLLPGADPAQLQVLQAANMAGHGQLANDLAKGFTTNTLEIGNIKPKAVATGDANREVAAADQLAKEQKFSELTGFSVPQFIQQLNKGQRTPQTEAAWKYTIGGDVPTDLNDYQQRSLKLQGAQQGIQSGAIDLQYKPQEKDADLKGKLLSNEGSRIGNLIKQIQAQYEPERQKQEWETKNYTLDEKKKKAVDAEAVKSIADNLQAQFDNGTVTEQSITAAQLQLAKHGAGNYLKPILDAYQPKKGVTGTAASNVVKSVTKASEEMTKQGFQRSPSGNWFNPSTGEWR